MTTRGYRVLATAIFAVMYTLAACSEVDVFRAPKAEDFAKWGVYNVKAPDGTPCVVYQNHNITCNWSAAK